MNGLNNGKNIKTNDVRANSKTWAHMPTGTTNFKNPTKIIYDARTLS
jgi:hypothetical protein